MRTGVTRSLCSMPRLVLPVRHAPVPRQEGQTESGPCTHWHGAEAPVGETAQSPSRAPGPVEGPDTPTQDVVPHLPASPTYGGPRSWFGASSRRVEARGNPVRVRDCPAAVSGNDRRHTALDREIWEATASRGRADQSVRRAHESEDLPAHRTRPGAVVRGLVGRPVGTYDVCAGTPVGSGLRLPPLPATPDPVHLARREK